MQHHPRIAIDDHNEHRVHPARSILGRLVENHAGETMGVLRDVMFDLVTGRITHGVVGRGGFLGIGERRVAVPFVEFCFTRGNRRIILERGHVALDHATIVAPGETLDFDECDSARRFTIRHRFRDLIAEDPRRNDVMPARQRRAQAH
jgi:sporulation protein YlmC with PRC-barrel domain